MKGSPSAFARRIDGSHKSTTIEMNNTSDTAQFIIWLAEFTRCKLKVPNGKTRQSVQFMHEASHFALCHAILAWLVR